MAMNQKDAASILGLNGQITPELVKSAFRKAASKYHPDHGGSVEMMQAVNEAYSVLKDVTAEVEAEEGYDEALNDAINSVIHLDGLEVEICGSWVWLSGNTYPHKDTIKSAGFKWASKKKQWYFRPEEWAGGRGNMSIDDIRQKHGSIKLKTKEQGRLYA